MKAYLQLLGLLFGILGLGGLLVYFYYQDEQEKEFGDSTETEEVSESGGQDPIDSLGIMTISSSAFENGFSIPVKYTCDGENVNPPIAFSNIPPETKSLALIIDDNDAPGGIFTHWVIWNISSDTEDIKENSIPNGANVGKTSYGETKYNGPCPPVGIHEYNFKLYALDSKLDLPNGTRAEDLMKEIEKHVIVDSSFVGTYKR